MSLFQAIVLAIVQGLTEFLPISSSAHLALAPRLLGWPDQGLAFDIALHFGTLVAILIYFWRDLTQIVAQGLGIRYSPDPQLAHQRYLLWLIGAASIPVGVAGLLFKHQVEDKLRNNMVLIACMLIGVALLMAVAEKVAKHVRRMSDINAVDAMVIGVAQALAIVPGTSRSGITITAALFRDFDHHAAARFSFLLSVPAIAAAALKDFWDLRKEGGIPADERTVFAVGILVSGLVGFLVISVFLRYLRTHSLKPFIIYRIVFGIIVLALALSRS